MISDAKIQKKLKWYPFKGQEEILKCNNREVIVSAGRGFGKSIIMAYIVFKEMASHISRGIPWKCFIVAPSYELTSKVFEHFLSTFLLKYNRSLGKYVSGGKNRPYEFRYAADTWIQCKSTTEPMSLLGERVDLVIVDEAALIPEKIYHQYVRPITASATKKGRTYYISTPRGRNWFEKKWYLLKEKGSAFHFVSTDGIEVSEEELEEIKKSTPELVFRQEYLAEFVSNAGIVFRDVDKIVGDTLKDAEAHRYVMGVDIAETTDWTVFVVIDAETKEMVYFDRFKGRDYPLQKKQIIAVSRRYNNARVIIDASGVGKPIYEDLMRAGVFVEDFTFTGKSKEELIGNLIVFVENKYIKIHNIPVLIDELKAYEYKYLNEKTGLPLKNIQYGAPQGYHDDCLKKGTLVKTINGYKPIEDIKVGDLVLTHRGRFKPVELLIKKPFDGTFYNMDFWGQADLELSYNHPLYSATGEYRGKRLYSYREKRKWVFPEDWKKSYRQISIKEKLGKNENKVLKESDFYKNGKQATHVKLRSIKLDKSFAKFLGLFLAEGHAGRMNSKDYRCSIAFNKKDKDLIREIRDYILSLGIKVQDREYGSRSGAFALCFESKFLHHILSKCYDKNREKQLPYYARYLGKDLRYTLRYWLKGDGWYRKDAGYWVGTTTSKSLALSMRDLAISVGKYAVLNRVKRHRYDVDTKDQYWVYIYNKPRKGSYIKHISKFEYGSRSRKIKKEHFTGEVYNLEVKDDKSFIANGIVVHNCVSALALAVWDLDPQRREPQNKLKELLKKSSRKRRKTKSFI